MYLPAFLLFFLAADIQGTSPIPKVRKVEIEGNFRVSAATIMRQVSIMPGTEFNEALAREDLRKLYGTNLFRSIEVRDRSVALGAVDVIYHVQEKPFVSAVSIEGVSPELEVQVQELLRKEKLEIRPAMPYQPVLANRAALVIRNYLRLRKHPLADVEVGTAEKAGMVRVQFQIQPGPKLEVGQVAFVGNQTVTQKDLLKQMQFTKTGPLWNRWAGGARYVPEELTSDLEKVRRYYQSRGYAVAVIGEPRVVTRSFGARRWFPSPGVRTENAKLVVWIPVVEGPRFKLVSFRIEGDPGLASARIVEFGQTIRTPSPYDYSKLENLRRDIILALGHFGYAAAQVQFIQDVDEETQTVRVVLDICRGNPVLVGKIRFKGNTRLPDKFLRRELRLNEAEVFDSAKLDDSINRLNHSNLIQEVHRDDVTLDWNEDRNEVDVIFKIKEKDRQGIFGTGGTGGIGGGYLGLIYSAFNLLRIGETLSLQLDGGAAQSNMLLNIVGNHFLGFPFTIALSGFNRFTDFNVANIVPGSQDLVRVLTHRSTGGGLSGAYKLSEKINLGAAFQASREKVDQVTGQAGAATSTTEPRSDLAPFFAFDSTHGAGPGARGSRLIVSQGLAGSALLRTIDTTRQSFQLSHYLGDPATRGRNAIAFRLFASSSKSQSDKPLRLEQRLYPGDETVRGFGRGGLSPWASVPGASSPLQPAGADTLLGFSAEYRFPMRQGLSGAAFFDLGWTKLRGNGAFPLGTGARLVEGTNELLRASTGGELRLQLPIIRQPGRLIFSWNPLRLGSLIAGTTSPLRIADPRGSIHFALGNIF